MMSFLAAEGAQNPLIPESSELIVGLLCFFIVFGVLGKKLLPNIQKTLAERRRDRGWPGARGEGADRSQPHA